MLSRFRKTGFFLALLIVCMLLAVAASAVVYAVSYHTIRINYVFADGTPAHDAYVATYLTGEEVSLTVTNPNIDGFVPMTLNEGVDDPSLLPAEGSEEAQTTFEISSIDSDVTKTVYYIAGLTPYKVMYYKQNIYDDLYSRDNSVSSAYTDRYGYTGSNPTVLETEDLFTGFTNLFHEPDSIAADGSTVFRVYYDRNYYFIKFDLGDGGFGVEPVYAKYQSVYHIGMPERPGYSFVGWARTNADSSDGELGTDWNYIDDDGNVITEEQARENCTVFSDGYVPAENVYYKAIWNSETTKYTIAYWIEKPDSELSDDDFTGLTDEESFNLITHNYSVVTSFNVTGVSSGDRITYHDSVENHDLFENAAELQPAYDSMSPAVKNDLTENKRYYELNEQATHLSYDMQTDDEIIVAGDGSTRINVFYNRKIMTLQFFYAKSKGGTLTVDENGNKSLEGGTISLTSGTKYFSVNGQDPANAVFDPIITQLRNASFQRPVVDRLPQIVKEGIKADFIEDTEKGHRYWYYEFKVKFGASLRGIWLNDAFDTQVRNDRNDPNEIVRFGSWAVQEGSRYKVGKSNYTVKGAIEELSGDILLTNTFVDYNLQRNTPGFDYTTLYFAASWDNTAASTGDWNGSASKVYNFTYKNYTQLLPNEDYVIQSAGIETFLKGGDYPGGVYAGNGFNFEPGHWEGGKYIDVIENNGRRYGLKPDNIIETIDAGGQYHTKTGPELSREVKNNQTAAALVGYTYIEDNDPIKIKKNYNYYYIDGDDVVTEAKALRTYDINPLSIWYDNDGEGGFDARHHADVMFFYKYNSYTLKYSNYNEIEYAQSQMAPYDSPLNTTPLKYPDPEFPVADLKNYYQFEGWYWDPYYINELDYDTDHMPADDTTFYAKWVPKKINVSFYPTYNDYYEQINRIKCIPNPEYDEDDPGDTPKWLDGEIVVDYGSYVPQNQVPIDNTSPDNPRPVLTPPASGAMFAGWYYLRDNVPVRFEPENIPVTALNKEASENNGKLKLFAEWVTKDVAKYKVNYVEAGTDTEVAEPTIGRAFVWKTRTFDAKSGSDLNEAHKWIEDGQNWWPTTNSHSIVVRSNSQGKEFEPNEFTFEYIQKQGVHYTVRYLDAVTRAELAPTKTDYSTFASIKEDAEFIPGYVSENITQTLVLAASTLSDPEAQRAEELENNVITFYYHTNDTEYLYEIEYYKQNVEDDGYTLFQSETKTVPIAQEPDITTVSIAELYNGQFPQLFVINGCTLVQGATEVTNTPAGGTPSTQIVADDAIIPITATTKTTIKMYFSRNKYPYVYKYVDSKAERAYLDTPEDQRAGMWDGVIETHNGEKAEKVEQEVTIPAPQNITYSVGNVPYIRIDDKDVTLIIGPSENNPDINVVKVYYRKFTERELSYKLVCANEDSPYTVVDYDTETGNPLYGGLSTTLQTVETQNDIQNVVFYNFNDAEKPGTTSDTPVAERYLHLHRYTFRGWFDNPEGTGTPLTTNATLTKNDLGLAEDKLPDTDATYYAVVTQDLVKADFEFRTVESALPENDAEATAVVEAAPIDEDGSKTGGYFNFTSPSTYENHSPIPWHRTDGYSLSIDPKDNKVYKYEFAEWWEEDLVTHTLIRHHNWNNSQDGWSPTTLSNQVTRNGDKHIIAVYKRRIVTELPYTLNYNFISRTKENKTYVKTGVLSGDQLDENSPNALITTDGDFRLTDEFILANAPYESNLGEMLNWSDDPEYITKDTVKGDSDQGTADKIVTDVDAVQSKKNVFANFKTTPTEEYKTISIPYGSNYRQSSNMLEINAEETYGGNDFAYWEVRKTEDGPVVAKSYKTLFDLCMMDNYWITPVFDSSAASQGGDPDRTITLAHIDDTRNTWTDENNEVPADGTTDTLYTDFEIAFNDGLNDIYTSPDGTYRTGVVFELCATLPAGKTFDPSRDYGVVSDPDNLKAAILANSKSYNYNPANPSQTRSLQISDIPQSSLTNHDRVQYGKTYRNTYKYVNEEKTYINARYLLKATAYLVKGNEVTLSNSVYVCLAAEAEKNLAIDNG